MDEPPQGWRLTSLAPPQAWFGTKSTLILSFPGTLRPWGTSCVWFLLTAPAAAAPSFPQGREAPLPWPPHDCPKRRAPTAPAHLTPTKPRRLTKVGLE